MNDPPAPLMSKLNYAHRAKRLPVRWRHWLLVGVLTCVALLCFSLPDVLRRLRPRDSESLAVACASNLLHIGIDLMMYANEHDGCLPGSFDDLLASDPDVNSEFFICPHGHCTAARGPTTQATLVQFARPGHCSYIYLGRGLQWSNDPKVVLAYEPLVDHGGGRGMNVLFGDGHVEFLKPPGVLPGIHWNERPVMRGDGRN